MRNALLTLAAFGATCSFAGAAEPVAPNPKADGLVAQLASGSFAEREAATKSLHELGADALPALKKSLAEDPNAEVQTRVASILAKIQVEADVAALTAGKSVALDFKDRPLNAAIVDLRAKLGIPLVLHPTVKDPARSITVISGELPPWQALEKFCAAAGLMEQLKPDAKADVKTPLRTGRRNVQIEQWDGRMGAELLGRPGDVPVTLVDGRSSTPADRRTGVRIQALPMGYPGSGIDRNLGELTLNLDVAPQTGLNWVNTTEVRIGKASTTGGGELQTVWKPDPAAASNPFLLNEELMVDSIQLEVPVKPRRTNPRVLPVTFKLPDGEPKSLGKLEGLVLGEIAQANQPVIEVGDLRTAAGQTFKGSQGSTLTVVSYAYDEKTKATTLVLRANSISQWAGRRMGNRLGESGLNFQSFAKIRYTDADGKSLPQPSMPSTSSTGDGWTETYDATLCFASGRPAKLVLMGTRIVPVALPFKLKDVPLE